MLKKYMIYSRRFVKPKLNEIDIENAHGSKGPTSKGLDHFREFLEIEISTSKPPEACLMNILKYGNFEVCDIQHKTDYIQ